MKRFFRAVLMVTLLVSLTGCQAVGDLFQRLNIHVSEDDVHQTLDRAQIILRARGWVDRQVPYGSFDNNPNNDVVDGCRADCSGMVSMAWQLTGANNKPTSPNTETLRNFAKEVAFESLQPGDAINNQRGGRNGHVVLFVTWLNSEHTLFLAIEENGSQGKAVQTELHLKKMPSGGWTIVEYDPYAPGPYVAQRLASLP